MCCGTPFFNAESRKEIDMNQDEERRHNVIQRAKSKFGSSLLMLVLCGMCIPVIVIGLLFHYGAVGKAQEVVNCITQEGPQQRAQEPHEREFMPLMPDLNKDGSIKDLPPMPPERKKARKPGSVWMADRTGKLVQVKQIHLDFKRCDKLVELGHLYSNSTNGQFPMAMKNWVYGLYWRRIQVANQPGGICKN